MKGKASNKRSKIWGTCAPKLYPTLRPMSVKCPMKSWQYV